MLYLGLLGLRRRKAKGKVEREGRQELRTAAYIIAQTILIKKSKAQTTIRLLYLKGFQADLGFSVVDRTVMVKA